MAREAPIDGRAGEGTAINGLSGWGTNIKLA